MAFTITVNKTRDLLIDKFDRISVDIAMNWLEGGMLSGPRPKIEKKIEDSIKVEFDRLENLSEENLLSEYDAYRERRKKVEIAGYWYNQDYAKADFSYWIKMPFWSLEEGLILVSGRDPRFVSLAKIEEKNKSGSYARWLRDTLEIAKRCVQVETLMTQNAPVVFLSWAKDSSFCIPNTLDESLEQFGMSINSRNQIIEDQKTEISKLEASLASSEKDSKPKKTDPRAIRSFQKLLISIVVDAYGYVPYENKGTAIRDILNALANCGIEVSDDTIRKLLTESEKHLPNKSAE